jgi:phospholipid transport system substrate-binding protein
MKNKKFLTFITFIIISILNVENVYSIEPDVFIQSTVNRASQALDSQFSKKQKIDKLSGIAIPEIMESMKLKTMKVMHKFSLLLRK